MTARISTAPVFQNPKRRLIIPVTLLVVALLVVAASAACSDATATPPPTATALPPTVRTAAPASTPALPTSTVTATTVPSPSPTATPETSPATPSPTALPPPSPTASGELQTASGELFTLLEELVAELGHRESATTQELLAAEHLKERLAEMGYAANIQPFAFEHFDFANLMLGGSKVPMVVVESPEEIKLPGLLLTTAPSGRMNSGPLTPVDLAGKNGLAKGELEGKIALIQPEDFRLDNLQALQDQVNDVAAAGAVAAVISGNWVEDHAYQDYRPLLGVKSSIPALLLYPDAEYPDAGSLLNELLAQGEVILSVKIETQKFESRNVVAELKGEGNGVVIVGGHYDIVPQTAAGANDNTSGVALVLALAEALSAETLPYSVRFIFFGAEEMGLYGSSHYVASLNESELGRIKAMFNFDVVASGPWLAVAGQEELTALALKAAATLEVTANPAPPPPWAASDHRPFEQAGVPVLLLYGPDVSRIHTADDRLEFVQPELLGGAFLVAKALLESPEFAQ